MEFRSELKIKESPHSISHNSPIVLIGSCFTQAIGERLEQDKFECLVNPFGILFNPLTIANVLSRTVLKQSIDKHLIVKRGSVFLHYDYHSQISAKSEIKLIQLIKDQHKKTLETFDRASHLFITMGTAYAYQLKSDQSIVANCHKQDAKLFDKYLLSINQMTQVWTELISFLHKLYPYLNIVLTVSPVRHIRDGIIPNNRSKARLIELCHRLADSYDYVDYFPSYELLMDDLRDYRFYDRDLAHPNALAEEYIFSKFETCYYSFTTMQMVKKIRHINNLLAHKSFHPESEEHQTFIMQTIAKIEDLEQSHKIDFAIEKEKLKSQLLS